MLKTLLQALTLASALLLTGPALAQGTPDALVRQISNDVLAAAKSDAAIQAGDVGKIIALVDTKVMPHVNFEVMTRSAVGPQWRGASAEQRGQLQAEFKTLLVRVYAGALTQLADRSVEITRNLPITGSTQVVVQSEVRGAGEAIKLDYRLDRPASTPAAAWKIIDVNVGGIWLVQSYRSQFAQELSQGGIPKLLSTLVERNKPAAKS